MRVIFMGSPQFAIPSLERLLESKHQILAVVTQPDKPAGRGQHLTPTAAKKRALEAGLTVYDPPKLKGTNFHETLAEYKPDALVVVAYGKILRPEALNVPRLGCVNVHASLLPRYRGAAPVQWTLIRGERRTGVTIMKLDEGMDTGPILDVAELEILDDDNAESLSNALSVLGADLLIKVLDRVEKRGAIEGRPQDHGQATYAPMLKKEDGKLDWSKTTEQIMCHLRGVTPRPGAYSLLRSQPFGLLASSSARATATCWSPASSRPTSAK
ncbi:MAG: methionyl-tRNA formyltransferase [Candidatus Sumerlaeota bacterium]|nr:methionyl-tRNA formyltransferase [Candidatus Sumerlaeota bacterium]